MTTLVYPYKPRPALMAFAALFFTACGWMAVHKAQSPHGGLKLVHVIQLGVDGATRFYWGMAAVCAVFVVAGLVGIWTGFKSRNRLVLTDTKLSVPTWAWSSRCKEFPLAAITRLDERELSGTSMLTVHYRGGKVVINKQFLPDAEAYDRVVAVLDTIVNRGGVDDAHVPMAAPQRRA